MLQKKSWFSKLTFPNISSYAFADNKVLEQTLTKLVFLTLHFHIKINAYVEFVVTSK